MVWVMNITLGMSGEIPVFSLAGRLDSLSSPILEEQLRPLLESEEGGARVVFDCRELSYVSSAGLRVLLMTRRSLGDRGGGVALSGLSSPVHDLLRLAGLDAILPIAASVDEAAALLAS